MTAQDGSALKRELMQISFVLRRWSGGLGDATVGTLEAQAAYTDLKQGYPMGSQQLRVWKREMLRPRVRPGAKASPSGLAVAVQEEAGARPLVPCLTRGSLVLLVAAEGGGLTTGFLFWASPAAPASADLALEADTAARTAAAPGALCFLFLPPMLQLRQKIPHGRGPGTTPAPPPEALHIPRVPRRHLASSIRASRPCYNRCFAIGPTHQGPASSPPT